MKSDSRRLFRLSELHDLKRRMTERRLMELDRMTKHLVEERAGILLSVAQATVFADISTKGGSIVLQRLERQIRETEKHKAELQKDALLLKLRAERLRSKGLVLRRLEDHQRECRSILEHITLSA